METKWLRVPVNIFLWCGLNLTDLGRLLPFEYLTTGYQYQLGIGYVSKHWVSSQCLLLTEHKNGSDMWYENQTPSIGKMWYVIKQRQSMASYFNEIDRLIDELIDWLIDWLANESGELIKSMSCGCMVSTYRLSVNQVHSDWVCVQTVALSCSSMKYMLNKQPWIMQQMLSIDQFISSSNAADHQSKWIILYQELTGIGLQLQYLMIKVDCHGPGEATRPKAK